MAFRYSLYPSNITSNKDDHIARSNNNEVAELEDIIAQITIPGSILKPTECRAVIDAFFRIISENLEEGIGLRSTYINIKPGLGGIFDGNDDTFDPARHSKQVQVTAGKTLKKAVHHMKVHKVDASEVKPDPRSIFDYRSLLRDKIISPGNPLEITGKLLKHRKNTPDEGVFFINTATNAEIHSTVIIENKPSKLVVKVPEHLPEGRYYVEVRARIRHSKTLTRGRLARVVSAVPSR